jgi:hypothetical protein
MRRSVKTPDFLPYRCLRKPAQKAKRFNLARCGVARTRAAVEESRPQNQRREHDHASRNRSFLCNTKYNRIWMLRKAGLPSREAG